MRLIDAEPLEQKLKEEYDELLNAYGIEGRDEFADGIRTATHCDLGYIKTAPTVEAIPIEWLEREFSRRGIVTEHFRVMVGNEQLPDEVYVDARIVVRDIIDVWREEQKDETDRSRAFD